MRSVVLLVALAAFASESLRTDRGQRFKGDAQDFSAVSADGRFVLATGTKKCANSTVVFCHEPMLALYRTADATTSAELTGPQDDYFQDGAFEGDLITATTMRQRVRWNAATSTAEWAPRPARAAGAEQPRIGHVESPDGAWSATIRIEQPPAGGNDPDDKTAQGPNVKVWVDVASSPRREPVRHLLLAFPERPIAKTALLSRSYRYWSGARMQVQFAEALAISQDGRWLAVGYGFRFGDEYGDTEARIAIFSLADGHRASVVTGARFRRNLFLELLTLGDGGPTGGVPLGKRIAFSPDSKVLYGTSETLFGVDVSSLR